MPWIRLITLLAALIAAPAARAMPPEFMKLSAVASDIKQDIRYAGANNFTGRPVDGYDYATCWLKLKAAIALSRVAGAAAEAGYRLIVWDCYRPKQATADFLRWAADPKDETMKAAFYPNVPKRQLFAKGYIGRQSNHSTGYAVDLGLLGKDGQLLDFGGGFDLFDTRSATASLEVSAPARTNRALLAGLMSQKGFVNYAREWWHYALPVTPAPAYGDPLER